MKTARLLTCLATDAARLREMAVHDLDAYVPSCPDWTVRDLVAHVSEVYQHKTESIRRRAKPEPWPPEPTGEPPIVVFDTALAELRAEFDRHDPADKAWTWYYPEQTVGFWIRRMAHETAIHRVDAELAAGELTPVAADLALDGIDEVLSIFLGWDSYDTVTRYGPDAVAGLSEADGRTVAVVAGARAWLVRPTPAGVDVTAGDASIASDVPAAVSGEPSDVLLWLWRRVAHDRVTLAGDRDLIEYCWDLLEEVTQ